MENPLDQLARAPKALLQTSQGRRALTKQHPGLFIAIYMREHITGPIAGVDGISFSDLHLHLYDTAQEWAEPLTKAREHRDILIAPRQSGKSTTMFLLLPMWAAAHGHSKFVAAFSDSASQAEQHLSTFKTELQQNELLRNDFPELVNPRKGSNVSRIIADNRSQYVAESGFVFMARGIDSGNLGMKVGATRPDLIIMDDVEPDGAKYSDYQAQQRLSTIRDAILYLNEFARVVWVGTTTMQGSLVHQAKKHDGISRDECQVKGCWICQESFRITYWPGIFTNDDGSERSYWEDRFPIADWDDVRQSQSFLKNIMNEPVSAGDGYWAAEHITIGDGDDIKTIVYIDPATTSGKTSDFTGIAVLSAVETPDGKRIVVREAIGVKLTPAGIIQRAIEYVDEHEADEIVIESNQGGDLWSDAAKESSVPLRLTHSTKKKEYRITRAFSHYERGRILHSKPLPALLEQMYAFPNLRNDDVLDAVATAILYMTGEQQGKRTTKRNRQASYV